MWICRHCNTKVEENLDVCWNCGYSEEGKPPADPTLFQKQKKEFTGSAEDARDEFSGMFTSSEQEIILKCKKCGTANNDSFKFCSNCGTPLEKIVSSEWEYKDFDEVVPLDGKPVNMGTVGSDVSYADIIQRGWADARPLVFQGIQPWLDKGWEPMTPIGPDCMEVETRRGFFGMSVYFKGVRIKMRRRRGQTTSQSDIPALIAKLAELKDAGVITAEEFEAKKKLLLGKI